jgi:DNA helicase-2/ATP-dependent DNA helicase PcrA
MLYASSRLLYGGVQHNPPSRFLSEIDAEFATTSDASFGYGYATGYDNQPAPGLLGEPRIVSDEPHYVMELNEGDSVRHQVFGRGTVLELDGDTALIHFKGKGTRKLNVSFAPLEKL